MGICLSCRRRERKAPEKRWGAVGPAKGAAAELLPRRIHLPAMANSISNIKMTNPIKNMVSRRRKRYVKDGFNLDLAYITDRLIAMGFPAEKLEGVYRNHIDEVYRFLEQMHKDHYKIYNLCSERSYDATKFHERVVRYAFEDHTPPNIELIQPFCEDVHSWLNADSRNVAAVHCKAGKGRTGTMVCCYLLYSGQKATADEALKFYGIKRAHDEKGVTIPSQRRYVEYYASLVRSGLRYSASKVHIREVLMSPPPALTAHCTLELTVTQADPPFKTCLGACEARRGARAARIAPPACTPLCGDVRLDVYAKQKMMMRKERLFHLWFNTFFVTACVGSQPVPSPHDSPNLETFKLTLNKWELDDAHKDKQHKLYSADFKVEIIIQKQPDTSKFGGRCSRPPSPPSSTASSCSEPDTEPDAHWDSGTKPAPLYTAHAHAHACRRAHAHTDTPHRGVLQCDDSNFERPDTHVRCPCENSNIERSQHVSEAISNIESGVPFTPTLACEFDTISNIERAPLLSNRHIQTPLCGQVHDVCMCVLEPKPCTNVSPAHTLPDGATHSHLTQCIRSLSDDYCKTCDGDGVCEPCRISNVARSCKDLNCMKGNGNVNCKSEGNGTEPYCIDCKCCKVSTFVCQCARDESNCKSDGCVKIDSPKKPNVIDLLKHQNVCKPCKDNSTNYPLVDLKSYKSVDIDCCCKTRKSDASVSDASSQLKSMESLDTNETFKSSSNEVEYKCDCRSESNSASPYDVDACDCKTVSFKSSNTSTKSCFCINGSCNCIGYKMDRPQNFSSLNYTYGLYETNFYKESGGEFYGKTFEGDKISEGMIKGSIPKVGSDQSMSDEKRTKPRLSLGDMRASWREFSGKFGESRKKKNKHD